MDFKQVVAILLLLIAAVSCKEGSTTESSQSSTTEGPIQKRSSIPLLPSSSDEDGDSSGTNGIGFKSLAIQIFAGIFKGLLASQGLTNQQVDQAINLFSPDKVYNDLQLVRRGLNLLLRLLAVLSNYFPNAAQFSLNPFKNLSNKVAFYATNPVPDSAQTITYKGGLPMLTPLPKPIQNMINILTRTSEETSTTEEATTTTTAAAPAVVEVVTEAQRETTTTTTTTTTTPTTTTTTTEAPHVELTLTETSTTEVPRPVYPPKMGAVISVTGRTILPKAQRKDQVFGLPSAASDFDERRQADYRKNLSKRPLIVYGAPALPEKLEPPSLFFPKVFAPTVTIRTPHEEYGIPPSQRQGKADKPGIGKQPSDNEIGDFPKGSNEEFQNFASIADLPLEQNTIYDRRKGELRDSFGTPVKQ